MREDHQRDLRAMLDARRQFESASEAQRLAWQEYLKAQEVFMGHFASSDYPLGPFVCGTTLIEHEEPYVKWPAKETVFKYTEVIRCPTSE